MDTASQSYCSRALLNCLREEKNGEVVLSLAVEDKETIATFACTVSYDNYAKRSESKEPTVSERSVEDRRKLGAASVGKNPWARRGARLAREGNERHVRPKGE